MTDLPPPRYRVMEKGRRLVVIDRGAPTSAVDPGTKAFRRTRFDGGGVLTTQRWYDDHGPREVRLGADAARTLRRTGMGTLVAVMLLVAATIWQPAVAGIAFAVTLTFINADLRAPIRRRMTVWLDRLAA